MSKYRDIIRFILSFFLMFAVIIMQLSFFVNLKVLNGDFYRNILNKSDYYSLMRKDIDFGFKNLSMVTSIPEEVFTSSVSDEAVKDLSDRNIVSAEAYMKNNNKYINNKIDTNPIYNNLKNYIQKDNIKADAALNNQLLSVSEDAGNIVNNYAVLFNISAVDKYPQFQSFKKLLNTIYNIKLIAVLTVLVIIISLVFLNRRRPRRAFLWIGSSLIPAAIMTLVPSILALYFKIAYRFAIDTPYIKLALKDIALGYIEYFIITGSIVLLLGIACMCIYTYLSKKAQENRSHAD